MQVQIHLWHWRKIWAVINRLGSSIVMVKLNSHFMHFHIIEKTQILYNSGFVVSAVFVLFFQHPTDIYEICLTTVYLTRQQSSIFKTEWPYGIVTCFQVWWCVFQFHDESCLHFSISLQCHCKSSRAGYPNSAFSGTRIDKVCAPVLNWFFAPGMCLWCQE